MIAAIRKALEVADSDIEHVYGAVLTYDEQVTEAIHLIAGRLPTYLHKRTRNAHGAKS